METNNVTTMNNNGKSVEAFVMELHVAVSTAVKEEAKTARKRKPAPPKGSLPAAVATALAQQNVRESVALTVNAREQENTIPVDASGNINLRAFFAPVLADVTARACGRKNDVYVSFAARDEECDANGKILETYVPTMAVEQALLSPLFVKCCILSLTRRQTLDELATMDTVHKNHVGWSKEHVELGTALAVTAHTWTQEQALQAYVVCQSYTRQIHEMVNGFATGSYAEVTR